MTIQKSCPTCGSPSHQNCKLPRFILSTSGTSQSARELRTDLLLLTAMSHMGLGSFAATLDRSLNGLLSKKIADSGFSGKLGEHLLIDLKNLGHKRQSPSYILLVGLGHPADFSLRTACGLFRLSLDRAAELGVRRLTIPFLTHRLTAERMNLRGTAAVLRCRVQERLSKPHQLGALEEIEILCSPQAKRHVQQGLDIAGPLHSPCSDPRICRS